MPIMSHQGYWCNPREDWNSGSKCNKPIKSTILDCNKTLLEIHEIIKLCWVPWHSNIVGNKMADELARGDSQSIDPPIEGTVKPPISYYVIRFKKALTEETGRCTGWGNLACNLEEITCYFLSISMSYLRNVLGILAAYCRIRYPMWERRIGRDDWTYTMQMSQAFK